MQKETSVLQEMAKFHIINDLDREMVPRKKAVRNHVPYG